MHNILAISFYNKQNLFCMRQCKAFAQFGIYLKICSLLPEQRKGFFHLVWFTDQRQLRRGNESMFDGM